MGQILKRVSTRRSFSYIQSLSCHHSLVLVITTEEEGKADQEGKKGGWKENEREQGEKEMLSSPGCLLSFCSQSPLWVGLRIGIHRGIGSAEMRAVGLNTSSKGAGRPLGSRGILSVNAPHRLNAGTHTRTPHGGLLSTPAIQRASYSLAAEPNAVCG